jgi:hypothetical protein
MTPKTVAQHDRNPPDMPIRDDDQKRAWRAKRQSAPMANFFAGPVGGCVGNRQNDRDRRDFLNPRGLHYIRSFRAYFRQRTRTPLVGHKKNANS